MGAVTADMLKKLARELGKKSPSWDRLDKTAGPVLQILGRYRDTNPGRGDDWRDLAEFLKVQVMDLVKNKGYDDKTLGAVLWHKVQVWTVVLLPPEEREQKALDLRTLRKYWIIVGKDGWAEWRRQYGLSDTLSNPFQCGRTAAYKLVAKGREALAEHLNGPITKWDRRKGGSLDMAFSEYRKVIMTKLAVLLDYQLENVYVQPRLVEITREGRVPLTEETLLEWLKQGESVLIQGEAGMGKSMLLWEIGLELLDDEYVPAWAEPGDVVKDTRLFRNSRGQGIGVPDLLETPREEPEQVRDSDTSSTQTPKDPDKKDIDGLATHLMGHLSNKVGISYCQIHTVAEWGTRERRVIVLVDDGEKWNIPNVKTILRSTDQRNPWYRSISVAIRSKGMWQGQGYRRVELEWDAAKLRELMEKRGNSRLWNKLEAWVAKGLLLRRPWEYAMAAEVSDEVETPVEMLRMAVMNRSRRAEKEGMNKQQVGRHLQTLRQEAWREIVEERDAWKPARGNDMSAANWAVQTWLMAKESEGKYRFAHNLLRGFLASEYPLRAKERKSPKEILESLIGVQNWESIVAWMGEIAVTGGETNWTEQLMSAIEEAMNKSWKGSGWLQGAKAAGLVLRLLDGCKVARQVREEAEQALIALLPPTTGMWNVQHYLSQAVGDAFLALAPLSEGTVEQLLREVYGPAGRGEGRRSLRLNLASEPGIARRLLDTPGILETEYGSRWLWKVARTPGIGTEALIGAAEHIYGGNDRKQGSMRLHAVVGALSTLGTKLAARRLGEWLARDVKRLKDDWFSIKGSDLIADGLSLWQGDDRGLMEGMKFVIKPDAPLWVWQGYLKGALKVGGAGAAVHLAVLVEAQRESERLTERQWTEVVRQMGAYGDEQVVPYLEQWWHWAKKQKDATWRDLKVWIGEALWGTEGERGVLARCSTEWLVRWIESAEVDDEFREMVACWVLRPRYPDDAIISLGRRWLEQGVQREHQGLVQAGAYLANAVDEQVTKLLPKSEQQSSTLGELYLAGRAGRWEKVLRTLNERLRARVLDWSLVALIGEEQCRAAIPTLIEYYLKGEEWIAQAGLYHFKWEDVDVCLETVWQMQGMKVDQRTANLLWKLGTPGAVGRVLEAMGQGVDDLYDFLPQVYREATWPLLADFVEESKNELGRWKVFGDIQSLWKIGEAWPWAVTGFFFHQLEDWDRDVAGQARQVLEGQIDQVEIRVWQGQEWKYRDGLREAVLEGTEAQRCMGLRWLSLIPQEVGKSALERWELNQLLEIRSPELQRAVLQYVTLQERHDLLDRVREIADEMTSDRVAQYNHEDAASLQSAVVVALGMLEKDGEKLIRIALGERVIPTHGWINAQGQALDALITRRQYLEVLAQAVQEGRAPASWLTAASVAQGTFLEEQDSEIIVRRGEKEYSLKEWGHLDKGQ